MNYQHKDLASGRWGRLTFIEQMANIGSEIERAINWRIKNNSDYSQKAVERALELIDLTLENIKKPTYFKEITRMREAITDYFCGTNQFKSSADSWRKYFSHFAYACRKNL